MINKFAAAPFTARDWVNWGGFDARLNRALTAFFPLIRNYQRQSLRRVGSSPQQKLLQQILRLHIKLIENFGLAVFAAAAGAGHGWVVLSFL